MATAMKLKCLTMIRQFDYNGRLTVCMCIYVTHTYIDLLRTTKLAMAMKLKSWTMIRQFVYNWWVSGGVTKSCLRLFGLVFA